MPDNTGSAESKRLRKPTKRLLESTEEYEQIFVPKKKSKQNASDSFSLVSCTCFLKFPYYSDISTQQHLI